MPEQLTKYPDVTLEVLRSSGAKCGVGAAQEILTRCPAERFCKLPGGELCVYGLSEARRMTQIGDAEWRALVPAEPQPPPQVSGALTGEAWLGGGVGLVAGVLIGAAVLRARRPRRRETLHGP
jgi:hypothetical protein